MHTGTLLALRGRSSTAEHQVSTLGTRVRLPSPALRDRRAHRAAPHVGIEPHGRAERSARRRGPGRRRRSGDVRRSRVGAVTPSARSNSASTSAPYSSASAPSHSHVSMTITAESDPQVLLYDPNFDE